jgi:chemotaxis regulatin CheY-phosphate phosphatase CheZ
MTTADASAFPETLAGELAALRVEMAALRRDLADQRALPSDGTLDVLRRELQEMASMILQAKREIAALRPQEGTSNSRIMTATEELDAIVSATERATNEILGKAERLGELGGTVRALIGGGDLGNEIEAISTDLLIACGFQDITGQRTTKVVNCLRYLETRINSMVEIWGGRDAFASPGVHIDSPVHDPTTDQRPDAHLLNGPQMEDEAINQADVDKLFG